MIRSITINRMVNLSSNFSVPFCFFGTKTKAKFRPRTACNNIKSANKNELNQRHTNPSRNIRPENDFLKVNGEILYGIYPVLMALKSGRRKFFKVYYNENSLRTNKIVDLAIAKSIPIEKVHPQTLNELSKNSTIEKNVHQGVCADVEKVPFKENILKIW